MDMGALKCKSSDEKTETNNNDSKSEVPNITYQNSTITDDVQTKVLGNHYHKRNKGTSTHEVESQITTTDYHDEIPGR